MRQTRWLPRSVGVITHILCVCLIAVSLPLAISAAVESPDSLRTRGETAVANKDYATATEIYNKLVDVDPSADSYYRRGYARFLDRTFAQALRDFVESVKKDPSHPRALKLMLQSLPHSGLDCRSALDELGSANLVVVEKKITAPEATQLQEQVRKLSKCVDITHKLLTDLAAEEATCKRTKEGKKLIRESASGCLSLSERRKLEHLLILSSAGLSVSPASVALLGVRAKVNLALKKYDEASSDARIILTKDETKGTAARATALVVRGYALYMQGDHSTAVNHFRQAIEQDPDNGLAGRLLKKVDKLDKAIKEQDKLENSRQYAKAAEVVRKAIAMDDEERDALQKLRFKLCQNLRNAKNKKESLVECEILTIKYSNDAQSWVDYGEALMLNEEYDKALNMYTKATQINPHHQAAHDGMHRAKLEQKKASRKDYFKILGVKKEATKREIKRSYIKLAKKFHPDMVPPENKNEAEQKFKEIGEAYEVLYDDEKRRRYEAGEDIQFDPSHHHHHPGFGFPFFHQGGPGGGRGQPKFTFRFG